MNLVPRKAFVSLCLLFFSFSAFAQTDLLYGSMSWIEGTWITEDSTTVETWRYTGLGFSGNVNKVVSGKGESIKLSEETVQKLELQHKDANWNYIACAAEHNNEPITFPFKATTKKAYGFYNPSNDFPQWIIYEPIDTNTLLITIKND